MKGGGREVRLHGDRGRREPRQFEAAESSRRLHLAEGRGDRPHAVRFASDRPARSSRRTTANVPVFTADIANGSKQGTVVAAHRERQRPGRRTGGKARLHGARLRRRQRRDHRRTGSHERSGSRQGIQGGARVRLSEREDRRRYRRAAANARKPTPRWKTSCNRTKISARYSASTTTRRSGLLVRSNRRVSKAKSRSSGTTRRPEARTAISNGSMYGDAIQHPDQIGRRRSTPFMTIFPGRSRLRRFRSAVGTYTKADAK